MRRNISLQGDLRGVRDATLVTAVIVVLVYVGSGRLAHLDHALVGYLMATLVAAWGVSYRVSAFWRRPPSAFYGGVLLAALGRPWQYSAVLRHAARDLAGQRFIARRRMSRWAAHMALAWGTVVSFAITVPLVWGWLRFEVVEPRGYRVLVWSVPVVRFATDGIVGWLVFHGLDLAAVAVVAGALYLLAVRLRNRTDDGFTAGFHLAPLFLLLAVAVTGALLPVTARFSVPWLFPAMALTHEIAVIVLLVALPFGKLIHVFVRPLQVGSRLVQADPSGPDPCERCGASLAVAAQLAAVEAALAHRAIVFAGRPRICPSCRRRELASLHAGMLDARFQLGVATRPAIPSLEEVA